MKKFYTLILCLVTLTSLGQSKPLVSKWSFAGLTDSAKIDAKGKEMMLAFFGSLSFTFQEGGLYQSYIMGKSEYGFWSETDSSTLILKTENGSENQVAYRFISDDILELKLLKKSFILNREDITKIITKDSIKAFPPAVSISKDKAAQKWHYLRTLDIDTNDFMSRTDNMLLEGAYMVLNKNGSFFQEMKLVQIKGTWRMVHGGKAFEMTSEGISQVFFIMKYEIPHLIFLNPVNGKQFLYSTEKPKE